MKGEMVQLDLDKEINALNVAKYLGSAFKKSGEVLYRILCQIRDAYRDVLHENKKSETLEFYRDLEDVAAKLTTMTMHKRYTVVEGWKLTGEAIRIIKGFSKVLDKQKSRKFLGKSRLATKENVATLNNAVDALDRICDLDWNLDDVEGSNEGSV